MLTRYLIFKDNEYFKRNKRVHIFCNIDDIVFTSDIEKAYLYKSLDNAFSNLIEIQQKYKIENLKLGKIDNGNFITLNETEYPNTGAIHKNIIIFLSNKTVLSLCVSMEKEFAKHNLQNEFNEFVDKVESKNLSFKSAIIEARKLITVCYY